MELQIKQVKSPKSNETYVIEDKIGEGSFAVVYQVINENKQKFAMKMSQLCQQNIDMEKILFEADLLERFDHPNIVKGYEHFELTIDSVQWFVIIMKLYSNGNMINCIVANNGILSFSVKQRLYWMYQMAQAIQYVHSQNLKYRDIKLQNFVVDENLDIALCDFNTAKNEDLSGTCIGTPISMAPEVLQYQGHTQSCDIWSLGCMFCLLLTGFLPFTGDTNQKLFLNIIKRNLAVKLTGTDCDELASYINNNMLVTNPHSRDSAEQVVAQLELIGSQYSTIIMSDTAMLNELIDQKTIVKMEMTALKQTLVENKATYINVKSQIMKQKIAELGNISLEKVSKIVEKAKKHLQQPTTQILQLKDLLIEELQFDEQLTNDKVTAKWKDFVDVAIFELYG